MPQRPLRGLRPYIDGLNLTAAHFASAPAARIASNADDDGGYFGDLCLSARCADCVISGVIEKIKSYFFASAPAARIASAKLHKL